MNNKIKTYKVRNTSGENYSLDEYVNGEFKETVLSGYKFIGMENKEDEIQSKLDNLINSEEKITTSKIKTMFLGLQSSNNLLYEDDFEDEDGLDFDEPFDSDLETDVNINEEIGREDNEYGDTERYNAVLGLNQNWNEIAIINLGMYYDKGEDNDSKLFNGFKKEGKDLFRTKLEGCTFLFKREDLTKQEIELLNGKVYNEGGTYMELTSIMNKCYGKRGKSEFQNDNIEIILEEEMYGFVSVKDYKLERYLNLILDDKSRRNFTVKKAILNGKEIEFRTVLGEYTN